MTDLHIHTVLSDGSIETEEIAELAGYAGLKAIAITNHDTLYEGRTSFDDVKIIPGVEMSAYDYKRGRRVHILCYMWKNREPLASLCDKILTDRRIAGEIMIKRAAEYFSIGEEFFYKRTQRSKSIYKQHIMKALMDAGFCTSIFGPDFNYLLGSESGILNEKIIYPDPYEVIKAAKSSGAVVVLAHPPVYDSFDLARELAAAGYIDGIEVWHSRNRPGDGERIEAIADEYKLIKTGGSDFHGMFTSRPAQVGMCVTPEGELERLISAAQ